MRSSLHALALMLSLLSLAPGVAAQQQGGASQQQLVVPLAGAGFVGLRLESALDGAQAQASGFAQVQAALVPQALLDDGNTIHRVILDRDGNVLFAYDLGVEPLAGSRQFRVTARPVGAEFSRRLARARRLAAATAGDAPGVPTLARPAEPQTLDDGDALALDLLVNQQTGVRVVDVVKVAFDRARLWQAAPRDFTLESVEIAVRDPRLLVNGELLGGGRASREVEGALVWFHVPGRGRFVLSLVPRAGYDFRKIALVEGNRISFDFRGDHFEWVSSAPVVGQGGDWYAWVLHDPRYTPEVPTPGEVAGGSDAKGDAEDESLIKQALSGKTPRPRPRAAFDEKSSDDARPAPQRARVRYGAADRMENVLPKK